MGIVNACEIAIRCFEGRPETYETLPGGNDGQRNLQDKLAVYEPFRFRRNSPQRRSRAHQLRS